jgi:outer membrane protein assembly factor BamE (lipoprotein component of BamABCDE complex)
MQTRTLAALTFALVSGLGFAGSALAETIVVDDQVQVRDSGVDRPKRGSTMTQVEAKFGAPTTKHDAVGQPPITRWDYAGFSVFFEHDRVIDAVATSG